MKVILGVTHKAKDYFFRKDGLWSTRRDKARVFESAAVRDELHSVRRTLKHLSHLKIRAERPKGKLLLNPHKAGSADKAAAKELVLFIENDGALYRGQTVAIMKNLQKKFRKGTYSLTKAAKLWTYLADSGAKKYTKEYGGTSYGIFTAATRRLAGRVMASAHQTEMKLGNFHDA